MPSLLGWISFEYSGGYLAVHIINENTDSTTALRPPPPPPPASPYGKPKSSMEVELQVAVGKKAMKLSTYNQNPRV